MKYFAYNLGCRVNSYELNVVENHLVLRGFIKGNKTDIDLDVIVINTCSVTSTSDAKSRKMIRYFRKNNPVAKIFVMGCFIEGHQEFSDVRIDLMTGTYGRKKIIEAIDNLSDIKCSLQLTPKWLYEEFGYTFEQDRRIPEIKIQDGCNNACSYCLVSRLRGPVRSRHRDNILKELNYLVSKGKSTFILVGINLGSYGYDFKDYDIVDLLSDITCTFPAVKLVLSSLELGTVNQKLLDFLKNTRQLEPHFHIPLQSGATKVLREMNRSYTKDDYLRKISEILLIFPNATFSTDIIVGFPGETDADFLETVDIVEKVRYKHLHIFPYSIREGTPAATMENQVPDTIKNARFSVLNSYN